MEEPSSPWKAKSFCLKEICAMVWEWMAFKLQKSLLFTNVLNKFLTFPSA